MSRSVEIRKARPTDSASVESLLSEWFDWKPVNGRLASVQRAIDNSELIVAETLNKIIGFIHFVIHEDVIDGGTNSFITAFYVTKQFRGRGVGSLLLNAAIDDSLSEGALGIETSTIHVEAKSLYMKHHFKQTQGDIGEVFLELDIEEYLSAKNTR